MHIIFHCWGTQANREPAVLDVPDPIVCSMTAGRPQTQSYAHHWAAYGRRCVWGSGCAGQEVRAKSAEPPRIPHKSALAMLPPFLARSFLSWSLQDAMCMQLDSQAVMREYVAESSSGGPHALSCIAAQCYIHTILIFPRAAWGLNFMKHKTWTICCAPWGQQAYVALCAGWYGRRAGACARAWHCSLRWSSRCAP